VLSILISELKRGDIAATLRREGELMWTAVEFVEISNSSGILVKDFGYEFTSLELEDDMKLKVTVGHGLLVTGWRTREAQSVEVGEALPTRSGWKRVTRKLNSSQGSVRVTVATSSGTLLVDGVASSTLCQGEFKDGQRFGEAFVGWRERHAEKWALLPPVKSV
jgi:hypothetical protein